jgi:chlorite dismutase
MADPVASKVGWGVLHLFCVPRSDVDAEALVAAVKRAQGDDVQVVSVALLGHKGDVAFMALAEDWWLLRRFQTDVGAAGLDVVDSYVSMTELSEYAQGVPDELRQARLHPQLPPEDKPAWCFYPMSKRRGLTTMPVVDGAGDPIGVVDADENWFTLPYDRRKELMYEHGASGRTFAGRILQVVTGSTGVDDFEWGVTLFGQHPDDLKEVVYTMRYDTASARYGEFGTFYAGMVTDVEDLVTELALG